MPSYRGKDRTVVGRDFVPEPGVSEVRAASLASRLSAQLNFGMWMGSLAVSILRGG